MGALGHQALPVRTGYELVEAHRSGEEFAFVTEQEGVVTHADDKFIAVQYKDGSTKTYLLGRKFGSAAGKSFPRAIVTDRRKGYKFKQGEVLAWDNTYFYRDWIETTQVSIYTGVPAIVAMSETPDTYEDGCAISARFAGKIGSNISHTRDMLVDYEEWVELLVKVGDHVESETPIARILPPGVDGKNLEETSIDYLSTTSPRAKYPGTVERIEVLYCGESSQASDTVRKIINAGDRQRKEEAAITGGATSGEINEPTYISKNYVGDKKCLIRVFITHADKLTVGDKIAFCNALKTVPGVIYNTTYKTVSGLEIDAKFSYKGIMARIVKSPEYMGVINMSVRQIGLNAVSVYRGNKK